MRAATVANYLNQTRPFLRITTPVIRDQIRPFARDTQPTTRALRIAADNLKPLTPHLTNTFRVVNSLLNTLAFNPSGPEEGFLFWTAWANHDANTVFGTQDAHGPIRRGLIITSCSSLGLLTSVTAGSPPLNTLFQLLNAPAVSKVCPSQVHKRGKGKPAPPKSGGGSGPGTPPSPTPPKPVLPPTTAQGGSG